MPHPLTPLTSQLGELDYEVVPFTEGLCVDTSTSLVSEGNRECAQATVMIGDDGSMDNGDKKLGFEPSAATY